MHRRSLLAVGLLLGTAGCTRRVTGWSQFTLSLRNHRDRPVTVRVTARVDGERRYRESFELAGGADRQTSMPFAADWGATVVYRAVLPAAGTSASVRWEAEVPTWGGNKCMIEPYVEVTEEGVTVGPTCVA